MNIEKDTLVGRINSKDFTGLKDDINKVIAQKIQNRIDDKKKEFINQWNGVEETEDTDDLDNTDDHSDTQDNNDSSEDNQEDTNDDSEDNSDKE